MEHMKKYHSELGQDCFFIHERADIDELRSSLTIKQEVMEDNI